MQSNKRVITAAAVATALAACILVAAVAMLRDHKKQADSIASIFSIREGLFLYYAEHGTFPKSIGGDSGYAHSWRTQVERAISRRYDNVREQVDLGWSWESPQNLRIARGPHACSFHCQRSESRIKGVPATNFFVVTGKETAFPTDHNKNKHDFPDGLENTVLIIETTGSDVPWIEPTDIAFADLRDIYDGNGRVSVRMSRKRGAMLLFADLAAYRMEDRMPFEVFQSLFTVSGAEPWTRQELVEQGHLKPVAGKAGQPLLAVD